MATGTNKKLLKPVRFTATELHQFMQGRREQFSKCCQGRKQLSKKVEELIDHHLSRTNTIYTKINELSQT